MPLIKPKLNQGRNNKPRPKVITLTVPFETWNELWVVDDAKAVLNELIDNWIMSRMKERDTYFISNDARVINLKLAPITEVEIEVVREQLATAQALGHNRKAAMLEIRLEALEANYIPPDVNEKEITQ